MCADIPGGTRFDYSVEPSKIEFSAPDGSRKSIVNLLISATNNTGHAVACRQILLRIRVGSGSDALTTDPRQVTGAPSARTPWAVGIGGEEQWIATPLPPAIGLAAEQRIGFLLANIVVNEAKGDAEIVIEELNNDEPLRTTSVRVEKTHPTADGGLRPEIITFAADPVEVALGANTTLSWRVARATSGALEPDGIVLDRQDIADGTVTLPVCESTTFTLRAVGAGGSSQAPVAVVVMPVEILSFTATPAEVRPGEQVTLAWFTRFAVECSIDQGIGPVPCNGQASVKVARTTIFTLRVDGLDPQTRAVTVKVLPRHLPPQEAS